MSDVALRELHRLATTTDNGGDWGRHAEEATRRGRWDDAALSVARAQARGVDMTLLLDALCPDLETLVVHEAPCPAVTAAAFDVSADGRTLVGFDDRGGLLVVDIETGRAEQVVRFNNEVPTGVSISPDALWAAVVLGGRELLFVNVSQRRVESVYRSDDHLLRPTLTDVPGALYVSEVRNREPGAFRYLGLKGWSVEAAGLLGSVPTVEIVDHADVDRRSGAVLEKKRQEGRVLTHDGRGSLRGSIPGSSGMWTTTQLKLIGRRVLFMDDSLKVIDETESPSRHGAGFSLGSSMFPAPSGRLCAVFRSWSAPSIELYDVRPRDPEEVSRRSWVRQVQAPEPKNWASVHWAAHGRRCVYLAPGHRLLTMDAHGVAPLEAPNPPESAVPCTAGSVLHDR